MKISEIAALAVNKFDRQDVLRDFMVSARNHRVKTKHIQSCTTIFNILEGGKHTSRSIKSTICSPYALKMSAQVISAVLHRALLGFLTDFTIRGTRGSLEFDTFNIRDVV